MRGARHPVPADRVLAWRKPVTATEGVTTVPTTEAIAEGGGATPPSPATAAQVVAGGGRAVALRSWAHLALALVAAASGSAAMAGPGAGAGAGGNAGAVPEPEGFRGPPYNAPVPPGLAGAGVITSPEALRLHAAGVPFIDVYPQTLRPVGLPVGTLWRAPRHDTVPGALWLPGTGFEHLSAAEQALLEAGLTTASGGDRAQVMVIFCRAQCWLGWNAAKRAVAMGYTGIRWFPDGVEGWQAAGGTLAAAAAPPQPSSPLLLPPDHAAAP